MFTSTKSIPTRFVSSASKNQGSDIISKYWKLLFINTGLPTLGQRTHFQSARLSIYNNFPNRKFETIIVDSFRFSINQSFSLFFFFFLIRLFVRVFRNLIIFLSFEERYFLVPFNLYKKT